MNTRVKAVAQYNEGVLVAKYPSIATASMLTEVQPAHIGKVASGLRNTAGGSNWKFTRFDSRISRNLNGLTQTDAETGEVIAVYRDLETASSVLGISARNLNRVLGTNRSLQGYRFA